MWTQTYKLTDLILYEGIAVAQSLLLPFPNLALCLLRRSTVVRAFNPELSPVTRIRIRVQFPRASRRPLEAPVTGPGPV
jgi:hypothetical protein